MRIGEPEAQSRSGRGTCVILSGKAASGDCHSPPLPPLPPPAHLVEALQGRSLEVTTRHSAASALADMVINERKVRGGAQVGPAVLLFVEPESDPRAGALADRVRLYAPHALIWRYSPSERPPLCAWNPSPRAPERVAPVVARSAPISPPSLRLTEHESPPSPPAPRSGGVGSVPLPRENSARSQQLGGNFDAPAPNGELLSQEELSMLLSDDWESHT